MDSLPDPIDHLLDLAGAPNDADARSALDLVLQLARTEIEQRERKQPRPELLKQLDNSIAKTLKLLQRVEAYPDWRDVCFRQFTSGDGIAVATSPRELFEGELRLPRRPWSKKRISELGPDGRAIAVNLWAVLDEFHGEVRPAGKRMRGQPKKWDRSFCVDYAKNFFENYSPHRLSVHPNGRFAKFCESFYSAIIDTVPETEALAWYIRESIKHPHRHNRVMGLIKKKL
jgi:hypothetical protein